MLIENINKNRMSEEFDKWKDVMRLQILRSLQKNYGKKTIDQSCKKERLGRL